MHNTIDYGKSPSPAFDAVEDIKSWLGPKRWAKLQPEMSKVKHCGNFAMFCALAGIQGYPVRAWYELINGQGSWKAEQLEYLLDDKEKLNE